MKFQFTCSVQRSQALQDHDQKHSRAVLLNSWQQLYLTKALKEWFPSVTPYGIKHETSQLTPRSGIFHHMRAGCFENLFGWFWLFLFKLWFVEIFHAKSIYTYLIVIKKLCHTCLVLGEKQIHEIGKNNPHTMIFSHQFRRVSFNNSHLLLVNYWQQFAWVRQGSLKTGVSFLRLHV